MIDLSKYDEIIIWGACFSPTEIEEKSTSHGHAAEKLYTLLLDNGYENKIIMWVDSNSELYDKKRYGKRVCSPDEILNHNKAAIIINSLSIKSIFNAIKKMQIKNDIYVIPYYFYHGVLEHPYDNIIARNVVEQHGAEIRELFNLEDAQTKRYLDLIFEIREKGEDDIYPITYYDGTGENMNYFCDPNISPVGDVTLIDVGAYDGESIEPVMQFYKEKLKSCIAFEPDRKSFQKLNEFVTRKGIQDICKCFPYALGDEAKIIRFSETGSTSQISEVGNIEIEQKIFDCLKLDNLVGDVMIKMDIEGAEENSLNGMKSFIKENRPYLAICIYHKEDDIYRIPKLIKSFYPGYKLYIRGGWHLECWAVPEKRNEEIG